MSADDLQALHRRLDEQDQVLKLVPSMHAALVGNRTMGHRGLVDRVEDVEKKSAEHDRKLVFATGAAIGISTLISAAKIKLFGG